MKDSMAPSAVLRASLAIAAILAMPWSSSGAANAQAADAQKLVERTNRGLVELITSADATSIQMAQDLASVVDDGATRRLLPVVGRGSTQNLIDLRLLRGIDVAVVQTDVLNAAKKQKTLPAVESSITYIAKLYNEELHVLTAAAIRNIAELEGKRVNFVSTASTTGTAVFDLLGIKVAPASDDFAAALERLKSGEIAALVYVAGKPASVFATLAKQPNLHFVGVPLKPEVAASYLPARLTAEDYPNLVAADAPVDTIAVGVVLVAAGLVSKTERYHNVATFVDAFFTQFPRLQEAGHHAKWQEVNLAAELPGWRRFPPAESWLQRNVVTASVPLKEQELRDVFAKFIDERNLLSGGRPLTAAEKAQMFDQFLQWQKSQAR